MGKHTINSWHENMEAKNIDYKLEQELVEIEPQTKQAIFEDNQTEGKNRVPFEMIVVTPPMHGPSVLKDSGLLDEENWVDVDPHTMMHKTYTTVFSLGDASNLPTVKMGGAVREQAPVLVENILKRINDEDPSPDYDGKTACPIATEYGELILAEFGYDRIPKESTFLDHSDNKKLFYHFKKNMLPVMYWYGMLKGRI